MRRTICIPLIASIAAVGLLASPAVSHAGGNDNDRSRTVRPSKRKPAPKCADPAKLGDATLAITDMPTGFADVPPLPNDSERAVRLGGGAVSSASIPVPTLGTVVRRYSQGTPATVGPPPPSVADSAVLLEKSKDASTVLKAFRDASAVASTWDQPYPDPPATLTFTSSALSFPKIGTETFAVRLLQKARDARFGTEFDLGSSDYVVWRRGPIISIVIAHGVDTLTFVKQADKKVSDSLVPCPKKPKSATSTTRR